MWLYFGTGRFLYRLGTVSDDATGQQALYGIKEPCYSSLTGPINDIENTCTVSLSVSLDLDDQSNSPSSTLATGTKGWYINLAAASGNNGAERVITDPLAVVFRGCFLYHLYAFNGYMFEWAGTQIYGRTEYDTGGQMDILGSGNYAGIHWSYSRIKSGNSVYGKGWQKDCPVH